MQVPILSGITASPLGDWRRRYPRNLVPVVLQSGISSGYLRPADGIEAFATGPGAGRGGYVWNGSLYRVLGSQLCRVSADGVVTQLGSVGSGGPVRMDAGFDRLAIWSAGSLYYWNGSALSQVTDPDLGSVFDGCWIAGYYASTDGTSIILTDLNDPLAVNPLRYGSAEVDPDGIVAVTELRNELVAIGRYTIEFFRNIGGANFPFQRIDGAQIMRGAVGTFAWRPFAETIAMVGSARDEAPGVYLLGSGTTVPISTGDINRTLAGYSEAQLAAVEVDTRLDRDHQQLLIHLPDQTLVYDAKASTALGEPVWFTLTSGLADLAQFRARHWTWAYDGWVVDDPQSGTVGRMIETAGEHYGQLTSWDFGTVVLYNEGRGAIVHELELVALPGRVAQGAQPVIWTSSSTDGETWSQERAAQAGGIGMRDQRIIWRRMGRMAQVRYHRFRGTSDARIALARLELQIEGLAT